MKKKSDDSEHSEIVVKTINNEYVALGSKAICTCSRF